MKMITCGLFEGVTRHGFLEKLYMKGATGFNWLSKVLNNGFL